MNASSTFLEKAKKALLLSHPYRFHDLKGGRQSAVLMLWGYPDAACFDPSLLITKRSENISSHKGQYAFPGGSHEESDSIERGLLTTALRETEEEVGIDGSQFIQILGELPTLSTPSGFQIQPFVGLLNTPIPEVPILLDESEVEFLFWVPLKSLQENYRLERMKIGEREFDTDVFQIGPHRIWGATGAMIKNFLSRLESVE